MIHKLVFDATDAASILASSNVGAYLRASDGTLLTHTDVSGKKALDVNVASGINVEVDLSHVDDSIKLGDGTDLFTSHTVSTDVGLDVYLLNASIAVTATQLDIDDLNATDDAVQAWAHDGTGNAIGSTGGSLDVNLTNTSIATTPAATTALKNVAETVGVAAAAIVDGADELALRRELWLYNNGNKTTYFGATGITVATGFPLPPGSMVELEAGPAMDIFMISDAAGQDVRTLQVA